MAAGQLLFEALACKCLVLVHAGTVEVHPAHLVPRPRLASLGGLLVPLQGFCLCTGLFQLLGVTQLQAGTALLRAGLPKLRRLLRLRGDGVPGPLGVKESQPLRRQGHSAGQGFVEPVLALGGLFRQVCAVGLRAGEGIAVLPLDPQKILPEIDFSQHILTERIAALRLFLNAVQSRLEVQRLLWQFAAAQRGQHPRPAAVLHSQAQNSCRQLQVFGKSVAAPHMLGAAEALGENAAGVAVSGGGCVHQQLKARPSTPGPLFIIDILQRLFHRVTEKISHR